MALILGAYLGLLPFAFILVMSGIGLLYNFKIIPDRIARVTLITTLKEIPGSKTMFTAMAWGVLAALIPVVCSEQPISGATAIAFFFVAGMIFIRSGIFEIMAIEGDRVVGKETLAIALGKERTFTLLFMSSLVFIAMLLGAAWRGVIPSLGYSLSLCGVYMLAYLLLYHRDFMESSLMLESLIEGNMILAGILAFIWDPYNVIF
jgi:4-hydroxy-3-methylbut-2-enyl diphosphate reductase